MCLLRRRLAGDDTPDTPAEQIREVGGPTAQRPDHPATDIPPLPAMQSLPDSAQRQIEDMTSVWVPARYSGFTPSVFRHIAIWPSALDSYHTRLCSLSAAALATPINQAQHLANREAEQLPSRSGELSALNNRETQWLQYTLDRFIDGMISPGVVLVPAMRAVIKRNS